MNQQTSVAFVGNDFSCGRGGRGGVQPSASKKLRRYLFTCTQMHSITDQLLLQQHISPSTYLLQPKREKHPCCFIPGGSLDQLRTNSLKLRFCQDLLLTLTINTKPMLSRIDAICLPLICLPDIILHCWVDGAQYFIRDYRV